LGLELAPEFPTGEKVGTLTVGHQVREIAELKMPRLGMREALEAADERWWKVSCREHRAFWVEG